ncbi:MAG: hypothetical protein LCH38_09300 [Proteobacteria bacterium]|nr:hypothetical protein [Pseudomonadota bacterium]
MKRILLLAGMLAGLTLGASAQFRAPAIGDASPFIIYGCDPCCFVTNTHASRPIHVVLYMILTKYEAEIEPGHTARFPVGKSCARGAMGLEVQFAG